MTDNEQAGVGYCYRHPARQSWVLCQRCGRTICGECQTPAPVGVICPECMREQRAYATPIVIGGNGRPARSATRMRRRRSGWAAQGKPVATYAVMGATLLGFLLSVLPGIGGYVQSALLWNPLVLHPWAIVTTIFVVTNLISVIFGLLNIWMLGQVIEQLVGGWRFIAIYVLSGMTGGVAMLLVTGSYQTAGSFASIFGLFGAMIAVQRRIGGNINGMLIFVAINLAINVFLGSWLVLVIGVGGVVGGLIVGFILSETRRENLLTRQRWLLGAYAALLVVIALGYAVIHMV